VATLRKLAEAGAIDASERVVVVITGEGLKTLDATREGFRMAEIEPTVSDFEAKAERSEPAVA
jgi:threonine synthase